MHRHNTVALALGIVIFLTAQFSSISAASAKSKVVVLDVQGKDPAKNRELSAYLVTEVRGHPKYVYVPKPALEMSELMLSLGCADLDTACLASIGAGLKGDYVLYGKVVAGRLKLQLVDVNQKRVSKSQTVSPDKGGVTSAIVGLLGPKAVTPTAPQRISFAVVTDPRGAKVFMNKYFIGNSPTYGSYLRGEYVVRITKDGFQEHIARVRLADKPVRLDIKMKPVVVETPVTKTPTKPKTTASTPVWKTWWFWTIIGAVVVGGAVAGGVLGARAAKKTSIDYGGVRVTIQPNNIGHDYSFR
ncbi:MAG: PEGA domain-containing protein [Myxococcales bacterium]|nr:PEGA domain-containing protein [Myxococcales bacterium]